MHSAIKKNNLIKIICILSLLIIISSILFLIFEVKIENIQYILSQRIPKLIAIILTGTSIAVSTTMFQTITDNRILTPNVMGLDSLYVLIQTGIAFFLGANNIFSLNKNYNFIICVAFMIISSLVLYSAMFKREKSNIMLLLLVGVICGTLFSSLSSFMKMMIDPNEYLILQSKLFASFNNINVGILVLSIIMIVAIIPFIWDDIKYLDVIILGKDQSINLGVNYDKVIKKFFIVISIFISISTALVGPITFLGLLVVNIARQMIKTYKHKYLIIVSSLISCLSLVFGQFLIERVFKISVPISIIINIIGGIYFMYLVFKESKG